MLPTTSSKGRTSSNGRPNSSAFPHYLRRIVKWQQMDIEYTFWQMLHLCTSPKVVYQHTKYHKQTKNQWARDDPAFIVICSFLLVASASAYCAAYDHSVGHAVYVVISALLFHFLITGAILATCWWFLTNNYLREEVPNSHAVEQQVEWLYAFDVHCNSFFPMFVLLYVIQYFLSPLLIAHGFIPVLLSNLLFMVAASYYHYLNFLGYDVLPFLERTTFFLYPIGVVIFLSPICKYFNALIVFLVPYFAIVEFSLVGSNFERLQSVEIFHEYILQLVGMITAKTLYFRGSKAITSNTLRSIKLLISPLTILFRGKRIPHGKVL